MSNHKFHDVLLFCHVPKLFQDLFHFPGFPVSVGTLLTYFPMWNVIELSLHSQPPIVSITYELSNYEKSMPVYLSHILSLFFHLRNRSLITEKENGATKWYGGKSSFTPTKKKEGGGGVRKSFSHAEGGGAREPEVLAILKDRVQKVSTL